MARRCPQGLSVVLTTQNTTYNLYTLLSALVADIPTKAQVVRLQLDPEAGSAKLFIGSSDQTISTTNCGAQLAAGQVWDMPSVSSNLYNLKDIILQSDTASAQVNCTIVTR